MLPKFTVPFILLMLLVWLAGLDHAAAQVLVLDWNASSSPDVIGYDIYYGTNSGSYPNKIDVGNATSVTVSNLTAGFTYYFTATAYDTNGNEGALSNEASYIIPCNTAPPRPSTICSASSCATAWCAPASTSSTPCASPSRASATRSAIRPRRRFTKTF
jgi:hypothetical protein